MTAAGELLGMQIEWRGQGIDEVGIDARTGRQLVRVDARYFRPAEVETLLGDATKAQQKLGWRAETSFPDLVAEMVESDLKLAKRDALVAREGFKVYKHTNNEDGIKSNSHCRELSLGRGQGSALAN